MNKHDELIQELIPQRDDADQMGYGYYAEAFNKAIDLLQQYGDALEALADDEWWDMETPSTAADFAKKALTQTTVEGE